MSRKGVFLFLVLAVVIAGGVFAQEGGSGIRHWISGEVSVIGAGARYEFMLTDKMSIGVNAYWNSLFFFWNEVEVGASFRYYIWKSFFAGAGLGFHIHTSLNVVNGADAMNGVAFSPEIGWKIDVGDPGKFFIEPGLKIPLSFGINEITDKFTVGTGFVPYFGMGFAF
ncbi:MAG: hypothetical protein LBH20_04695 [Treponema sp.]|nr:hypothetical protein [Treponema sp.]